MAELESVPQSPQETSGAPAPSANRSALLIVFLVVFIDLLGFGIVLPLLPLYANDLLKPIMPPDSSRMQGLVLGLLMASFSAMQFIFSPIWGRLSDRIGRRPILLFGLAGSVFFYALFGVASEIGARGSPELALVLLFVSRIGAGIAGATIATAQAVIADSTTPEKRSHGMALIGIAFGIGFTFGPLLGFASLFAGYDGAPGFLASAFSLVALFMGMALMPETLRTGAPAVGRRHWLDRKSTLTVLRTPTIGILVLTFFLATFAFGSLESTLALVNNFILNHGEEIQRNLSKEAARTTEKKNFLVFAYVGFVLMMTQGLFYRRLVHRVGEVKFMRIGVALMAAGFAGAVVVLLMQEAHVDEQLLLGCAGLVMTVAVIGFACLTPSAQALISRRSDPAKQGEVLGVNQSASALARILGPMIGLSLFGMSASHALPYVFGTVLLFLVFLLTLRIHQE